MEKLRKYYINLFMLSYFLFLIVVLISGCSSNIEEESQEFANKEREGSTENMDLDAKGYNTEKNYESNQSNVDKKNDNKATQPKGTQLKEKQYLDVPLVKQNPQLKYGCEITSLTMVLQYAGFNVDKMTLAKQLEKDNDKLVRSKTGDIVKWGDPDEGFVGDMTGRNAGYAVFDQPIEDLMREYLGDRTVNLTGDSFDDIYRQLSDGKPVIAWTTGDYRLPDRWESWQHGDEKIKTPLDLHAVVIVGYDSKYLYLNDPLSGEKAAKVEKDVFIGSWKALKKRALSYN